jgi:sugar lactone lactonase YvrE
MHKFDPQGNHLLTWGYDAERARGEIRSPKSASFDPITERIYIVAKYKPEVMGFDIEGNYLLTIGKPGQHYEDEGMDLPDSIDVDLSGNIYVGCAAHEDPENITTPKKYVKVFDSDGNFLYRWGGYTGVLINGISIDQENSHVYITLGNKYPAVKKFDKFGNPILEWGTEGTDDGQFQAPWGIAVNPATGNVFVSDTETNRIQKFSPNGTFLLKWGDSGSGPGQFNAPRGISFGPDGYLYVSDSSNNRVQAFDPVDGSYLFSVRYGINAPYDVTFDSAGDLYVTDYHGSIRVTKYTWSEIPPDCPGDFDCDGILDSLEETYDTDPYDADTDADQLPDGWEVDKGLNPLVDDADSDPDNDNLTNFEEYLAGSDPRDRNDPEPQPPITMPWIPLLLLDN